MDDMFSTNNMLETRLEELHPYEGNLCKVSSHLADYFLSFILKVIILYDVGWKLTWENPTLHFKEKAQDQQALRNERTAFYTNINCMKFTKTW